MPRSRRTLTFTLELVVVLVILTSSVLVGPPSVALAWARPAQPPGLPEITGARFVPNLFAQQYPAGTWYAPQGYLGNQLYGPQLSVAPNLPVGRKPGEQPDLRTAASETILNPDGTWTLKSYPFPIHYRDAQGQWQPIDNTLASDTSIAGYSYSNRANAWRVRFAPASGGPNLVHAQFPGLAVKETLEGAANVRAQLSKNQALYAGVFPGVDLQYLVGTLSLEELLLLHDASGPASYTFTYHLPGVTAEQDALGTVRFKDAKGNVLLTIGNILMYEADAQGQMTPTGALSQAVKLTLTGSGPDFHITLTPDQAWLKDAHRQFPVVIDPSWQGSDPNTNTSSGNIYADTIDESGNPNTLFYDLNALRIGNADVVSGLVGNGVSRAYLKFPINPAPAKVHVTSADLAIYQSSARTGGGVTINASMITSAWNATTLDWNNHPTSVWGNVTSKTATDMWTWVHFNVTQYAYLWWQAGWSLNGIRLQYADETKAQEAFFSDDNTDTTHRPVLTINYVQDTTAPTGNLLFNGGASSTNQSTVALTPAGSDPGAVNEWSSSWETVNGIGVNGSDPAGATSVDGTQLTVDTSSCGATQCWIQTYFTHTLNINNWPTFTAMFKTDSAPNFYFGAVSQSNINTRFEVQTGSSSTAFTKLDYATTAGAISQATINIPFSANTWYYGQVDFPLPNVGEIYIWPVGQVRPTTPSVVLAGIYMTNPALNFFQNGDNGANLHHAYIGNVNMTSKASSGTGYGLWGMSFSGDGATYTCPAPASSIWCVYSADGPSWTLSSGDGKKTVWFKYVDNAGNTFSGSSQIIYDTTPPSVTGISPGNSREVRGVVTVTVTGSDPAASDGSFSGVSSAVLYVDGVQAGTPVAGASTPTFLWDTTNLSQGVHTLTAKVTDAAGNTGAIGGSTQVVVATTALMSYEMLSKRTLPDGQTNVSANTATGDALVSHVDLDISGRGPDLSVTRTWQSLGLLSGYFGAGWSSEFDEQLTLNADTSVSYQDAAGGLHIFLPNGSGGYLTPLGLYLTLVKNGDGTFTISAKDQSKTKFSATGLLTSIVDRNGNTLTFAYTGGMPSSVTDAAGRQLALTSTDGHITHITAPGSRTFDYAYDGSGNLTDYTDPSGVVTHYDYDSSHRLTKITLNYQSGGASDFQTNVATTLTYDTSNRLVKLVDPLGYDAGLSYSANGASPTVTVQQLQGISPATYATTVYQLSTDGMGMVTKLTNPVGGNTLYQYDANGNVTQMTDPDGHVATTTYDANANVLTHVIDPGSGHLNLTTSATYDSANNVLTATDPRGIVTRFTYDSPTTGNVLQVVQNYVSGGPQNSDTNVTATATYDAYGEVLTLTDSLGIVTRFTYDSYGNVLTTTTNYVSGGPTDDHTNVQTSTTYDILGEPLTATNPLGIVTTYGYDLLGHVIQKVVNYKASVQPDQQTNVKTTITYDALGRPLTLTNPLGIVTETVYDADGRVVQTIADYVSGGPSDTQTNVILSTATYDAAGNVLTAKDAKNNLATTIYDVANRPVQVTRKDSGGAVLMNTKMVYDVAGFTSETDLLDSNNTILRKTTYTYDGAGRQATSTAPPALPGASGSQGQSNVTTYTYDADGNTLDAKTTNAAVTGIVSESQATFDKLNRALSKTEQATTSSTQTSTFTYDLDGRNLSFTDPAGNTTTLSYDPLGRVTTMTQPDGSVQTLIYDAASQLLSTSTNAGTTTDAYDPLGRVTSEERDDAGGSMQTIVITSYDANDNKLTELTNFPGGPSTVYTWTYDKLDRPVTMSDGTRTYTYDLNGNVTAMTASTALQATASYDGLNRTTQLVDKTGASGTTLHNYSYSYDAFGNRTQITEDGTTTNYTYDTLTQLTKIQQGSTTTSFTYDAHGNRATMVTSAGTTTYTYDSAGAMLLSKKDPNGKVTNYTYNTQGSLTKATYDPTGVNQITTYTYDASNRLTGVTKPGGSAIAFSYDADGNRISKTVTSGSTSTVIKDVYALGHLAYQTDGSGTVLATFTYDTGGMPSSVVVGSPTTGPRYFYIYNGHGDVVALTDSTGTVVASYSYDAFGTLTSSSESFPGGWSNPYRYDGAEGVRYDAETGLYWMSVRAYDPALGRFLSHDPLGRLAKLGLDLHPYVYVGNNPLTHTDPSGMMRPPEDGGGGGSGGSGSGGSGGGGSGGSGGSGGGHTGGSSTTQQPTYSTDPNCKGLTVEACASGYRQRDTAIEGLEKKTQVLELGIGVLGLALHATDLWQDLRGLTKLSGGDRWARLGAVLSDIVGVLGDLGTIVISAGKLFNKPWVVEIGRLFAKAGGAASVVLTAYRAVHGWWARVLEKVFNYGMDAFSLMMSGSVEGAIAMVIDFIVDLVKNQLKRAVEGGISAMESYLSDVEGEEWLLQHERVDQYCHSPGVHC